MVEAETFSNSDESAADKPSMDMHQISLWKRLEAFSIDEEADDLPFSKRLARDNGWTIGCALEAIEEYKRFAFLAAVADHPVTPSDRVDQVWHLHLAYTRSYWDDFCANTLKEPWHHEPIKGGNQEAQKFDEWYRQTLESYEQFFEQEPPIEIWPTVEDRFGRDLQFVRVNEQQKWVVPKLPISREVVGSAFAVPTAIAAWQQASSVENISLAGAIVLTVFCAIASFSLIQIVAGFLDSLNRQLVFPYVSQPSGGLYGG